MNWNNRKFQYGDGFFETLIVLNRTIRYWDIHFKRITHACEVLSLDMPNSFEETLKRSVLSKSVYTNSRIKIQFWRNSEGRYTPSSNTIAFHIEVTENEFPFFRTADRIEICKNSSVIKSRYSSFKCFMLPYIIAAIEKQDGKADDLILLNQSKAIAECISSNIFWLKDGELHTPSLNTGCVNGVMRQQIFSQHTNIIEIEDSESVLIQAQSIFTTNVTGITQFKMFGDKKLKEIDLENIFKGI